MENVNVLSTVTALVEAAVTVSARTIILQNQSDVNMRIAVGDDDIAQLTADLGYLMEPGDSHVIQGTDSRNAVSAIRVTGTGTKNMFVEVLS